MRPSLTFDATVNTDFAQVEADEEQVNLTRFDLFFPEKRPFFLENASTFQFGQPQSIDLFFSRRIGLSGAASSLQPIDILAGTRLSGKLGGSWNVGFLNVQTSDAQNLAGDDHRRPTATSAWRACRRKSAARATARSSSASWPPATSRTASSTSGTAPTASTRNYQLSPGQRISAFVARTDSPNQPGDASTDTVSDYSWRAFYDFRNPLWQIAGGYSQVGENFNPEVGFLPRRGYRRPEGRIFFQPQPKNHRWIRRYAPHVSYNAFYGFDDKLQTSALHFHPFEIQPMQGGRFGCFFDRTSDSPLRPFTVYNRDGKRVVVPVGEYAWWQSAVEYFHNPSAPITGGVRYRFGNYYNGDFKALELTSEYRFTARVTASLGWTRQDITLPSGSFVANLIPFKTQIAFTNLASLSVLAQYNGQSGQYSTNARLALLNRSGTGLFVVFNDRRDVLDSTSYDTVGRSLVVKFTRLFDF